MPLFRLLARCRGLRGSAFDPFGYSAERRQERRVIGEFEADIDFLLSKLEASNLDVAADIARLPQKIRGFGHVKQASIDSYYQSRARLMAKLDGGDDVDTWKPAAA